MTGARTVFLTTSFPRFDGDASGHFVEAAALSCARDGATVEVIAPGKPPALERRGPVAIHWMGGEHLFGWPGLAANLRARPHRSLELAGVLQRTRRALAGANADRIAAHWLVPSVWPLAFACDTPVDGFAHGGDVRLLTALPRHAREALVARIAARARSVTFAAGALRDELLASLSAPLRRRLARMSSAEAPPIRLPDVPATRDEIRARFGSAGPQPLLVSVGRLVPSKRHDLAIRAAAAATGAPRLVIVGGGPERARLEALARRCGSDVHFTDTLPHGEAVAIIAAADALLHASAAEGAPTVVREARALSVPVIACASGDLPRWAAVDPGIRLVPPTSSAFAAAITALAQRE